jgi:uncharacterized membrane protein
MKSKLKFGIRDVILLVIGLIPLIVAAFYYSKLPEQMASHFGINGEANGSMKKEYFLLLIGLVTIGIPMLFKITRHIDPKRLNYIKFEDSFELMRLFISILLSGLFLLTIFYNLGYTMGIRFWGIPATGVFFILIGNILGRIRFNYFFGIRTPWTLANEEVWRRTHRFGGPIFMIGGILMLTSVFFEKPFLVILTALLILIIVPIGYSYVISRKINQKEA